jgi:L-2-hydroxyglutarate oxidase LhgO
MMASMTTTMEVEVLVVGAGIMGLATAVALGRRRRRVVVIERNVRCGLEVSSRSSEVLHGGLYYEPGSWRARTCVEGAELTMERCRRKGIALNRRGKLVVADGTEQEEALARLLENARECGARDLELWGTARLRQEEPDLPASAAIWSPWTAVVDSDSLVRSYAAEACDVGADIGYRHRVIGLERRGNKWEVAVADRYNAVITVSARVVVNAAGLASDEVAAMAGIDIDAAGYRLRYCKGDYFSLGGTSSKRLSRLIYPLPDPCLQSLGLHLTLDVGGRARLGPDVTYLPDRQVTYDVDEAKLPSFLEAGRRLVPWLEAGDLSPESAGIRPRLFGPGEPARDFVICHENDRGLPGLMNLIGIESPGLTAAPAIARHVVKTLIDDGVLSKY